MRECGLRRSLSYDRIFGLAGLETDFVLGSIHSQDSSKE